MPARAAAAAPSPEREGARCDLVAQAIARFGAVRMRALGGSMLPAIWPGDILSVQKTDPQHLAPADVVVFRRGARIYAHRLVTIGFDGHQTQLATRGDALHESDAPVSAADVLGRVSRIERGPFRVDPRAPAGAGWRLALAALDGGRWFKRCLSSARRGRAAGRAFEVR